MVSKKFVVQNEQGLHMRPAGVLAKAVTKFESDVTIIYNDKKINAKSLLNIIGEYEKYILYSDAKRCIMSVLPEKECATITGGKLPRFNFKMRKMRSHAPTQCINTGRYNLCAILNCVAKTACCTEISG